MLWLGVPNHWDFAAWEHGLPQSLHCNMPTTRNNNPTLKLVDSCIRILIWPQGVAGKDYNLCDAMGLHACGAPGELIYWDIQAGVCF